MFNRSDRMVTVGAASRSRDITGLANGTKHFVRVVAVNDVDDGEPSAEVSSTPATAPGAPRSVVAEPGDASISVTWAAAGNGGSAVTAYRVQWRANNGVFVDSDPQVTVGGREQSRRITRLANGTVYFVQVMATNDVGDGPWSLPASAAPASAATSPGPPGSVAAVRGDGSVTVTWAAPTDTGGSEITRYKVQWRTEDEQHGLSRQAAVGAASRSREITGLTNGTKHFVRVVAVNDLGDGEPSAEVPSTPATTPGAPQSVVAERGDGSVTVRWAAAGDGGSAITGYRVQWRTGAQMFDQSSRERLVGADDLSYLVAGLANGTQHFVRVVAVNDVGDGEPSAEASSTPARQPEAPRSVAAQRGDRSVTVRWAAAGDGGSAVTGYRVQWRTGGQMFNRSDRMVTVGAASRSRDITGLANGTKHFVRVVAVNDVDDGEPSAEVSSTPATAPGAPRSVVAEPGDASISVTWAAAGNGGSAVTAYRVQWRANNGVFVDSDPQVTVGGREQSRRITRLANGTVYFVQVMATNDVGDGPWSLPASAAPASAATSPGPPGSVAAVRGDGSVTVTWAAPTDTGGSEITRYKVQWRTEDEQHGLSRQAAVGAASRSREITGLTNGTKHFVRVVAVNDLGDGEPSAEVPSTPATTPGAPQSVVAERGDGSVTVRWAAAGDGGSAITGYRVQWRTGAQMFDQSSRERLVGADDLSYLVGGPRQRHAAFRAGGRGERCGRW